MTRRIHAIVVFLVTLLVVAACGVSFASADVATDRCGPEKGWGPAKVDSPASAKPLLDLPAILVGVVDVSEPALPSASVEDARPVPSRVALVRPRAPRAPPLV